jgi:secreted Zn-dependent insulinase-like peptidase
VTRRLADFSAEDARRRLEDIKGERAQTLTNANKQNPIDHAAYAMRHLHRMPFVHRADEAAALQAVTAEAVGAFLPAMRQAGCRVDALCWGNVDAAQVSSLTQRPFFSTLDSRRRRTWS